jgi:hypothetical protein
VFSWLVAAVVVAVWLFDSRATLLSPTPASLSSYTWLGLVAVGILITALKSGVVDRFDTPLRPSRLVNGQINGARYSDVTIAERLRLLGYEAHPKRVAAGDVVIVDLYWTVMSKLPGFGATVRVVDESGLEWSDKSERYQALGGYSGPPPVREWPLGMYADDRHAIQVLPGTPPGAYRLVVLPFDPDTLEPLVASTGQPAPGGHPGVVIGQVDVTTPARPPAVEALNLAVRADVPMGDDLVLVGYSLDREEVTSGQTMLVTLGWQVRRQPQSDYVLHLELVAPDGQVVAQQSHAPGGEHYPTSRWAGGQIVRSQVLAHIPGRAASGQYAWRVTLFNSEGTPAGQTMLTPLRINAPMRVFDPPALPHRLDARLGNWVALTSFDAPVRVTPGQAISVTLVWQALQETEQDFKVFVHLLGADGRLVAQSDAVPARWTRPTAGWQAGEFVTDVHTLDLKPDVPSGVYRLAAGMYAANTGQRLTVASGGDRIELGTLEVTSARP